ncbi:ATP-binding domain-containing protein [Ramlibacter solisilvae]|uniref:NERD domain-containing protein n=1 Tax=Ramlibacter tataouinensis TaxID=94132 RepID=A0A127JV84_9BURK|nr:nuclease-related domain-containing protein [Ramlibacter tataouinensis]AMO23916.1 hypothetical protein UC35_14910 [Ramlibacter tataouinensis]
MKVYPHYLLRPQLRGEGAVYDLLSRIGDDSGFAVHSVNLPEHEYKRWAEADFVLVRRDGLILLEVKGGTVTLAGREWRYENARGQAIVSSEGPAKQAITAAVALEKMLGSHLGRKVRCRWGVVFPLCRFSKAIAELPPSRLADDSICNDPAQFSEWLRRIPFDRHPPDEFSLSDEDVDAIRSILVPEFSATATLGLAVRSAEQQIVSLTSQQFAVLECLQSNPRLTLSGGAGTGKTELAALCARAEKAAGRKPAIVTPESPLSAALTRKMKEFGVPVVSRSLPVGTDTLIVDEGQDYANPAAMTALFDQLPGGLSGGRWRWFMDPNLQFVGTPPDSQCLAALTANSTSFILNRNVRSTKEIVSTIQAILDADVGISQIDGFGIRVEFHDVTAEDEAETARRLIMSFVEEGVPPRDIAVLGAGDGEGPVCRALLSSLRTVLKRASPSAEWSGYGVVSAINAFRGLEAKVVVLVDLDRLCTNTRGDAELYIGMSRASAALHLLVSQAVRSYLGEISRAGYIGKGT